MSHHHITTDDRREIATLLLAGHSHSDIAKYLGKHQTSISREISTYKRADGSYRAGYADKKAKERRLIANQRFRKLGIVQDVTQLVVNKLELYWSPEQIAGRMKHEELPFSISHTAIYQYVYQKRPDLVKYLRFHHNRYRRRYGTKQREAARVVESNKRSIDIRPEEVNLRATVGHWEGDTVVGTERTVRLLTHAERKSGYLLAQRLDNVTAESTRASTTRQFKRLPSCLRRSITYDNGAEFHGYELLERELRALIYFAHPYHSWERGTNENANGLLRQFYPKKTAFATITSNHLKHVVKLINQRPRKRHNYQTPEEVLTHAIRTLI